MRTYTITDVNDEGTQFVVPGVVITNGDAEPGLRIGEESATIVPVAREGVALFKAAKGAANEAGFEPRRFGITLRAADISDRDGVRIIKERGKSPYALVHVAMCAGVGGRLWIEAAGFDEVEDDAAVRRQPRMFPGAGVEVVAIGHGPQGEPHALLKLKKGAAFRICRNGALNGLPPAVDINWNGHEMFARPAPRYRKK